MCRRCESQRVVFRSLRLSGLALYRGEYWECFGRNSTLPKLPSLKSLPTWGCSGARRSILDEVYVFSLRPHEAAAPSSASDHHLDAFALVSSQSSGTRSQLRASFTTGVSSVSFRPRHRSPKASQADPRCFRGPACDPSLSSLQSCSRGPAAMERGAETGGIGPAESFGALPVVLRLRYLTPQEVTLSSPPAPSTAEPRVNVREGGRRRKCGSRSVVCKRVMDR